MRRLRGQLDRLRKDLQAWLFEFGAAAGLLLAAAGLWLFHPGLSLAVPGGLLLAGSLWAARGSSRLPREE
jgi:hypothetical protein